MKVNQVIAMWKLVANNSFLLKALLTAAGILFVISLLPKWHPIMVASIFLSLVSLFFANILLIANAAKLTDSKHIQILPNYRPIMLVMFLGWFIALLLYVFLVTQLTVTHDRADLEYFLDQFIIMAAIWIVMLVPPLTFDRKAYPFVFLSLLLLIAALGNIDYLGLPSWVDSILYSVRTNIVKSIPVFALLAIVHWAFSPSNRPKFLTSSIDRLLTNIKRLNFGVQVKDVNSLHVIRHNQSYFFLSFCWLITLVGFLLMGDQMSNATQIQKAGALIIAQLWLIYMIPDNSIFHLRQLWLKSQGDRDALFTFWETKKIRQLLAINVSLVLINLIVAWWYSYSLQTILLVVGSVFFLSFSSLYARALSISHYWVPATSILTVCLVCTSLVAKIFLFSTEANFLIILAIAVLLVPLTLTLKIRLKKQITQLDWLLIPKPAKLI